RYFRLLDLFQQAQDHILGRHAFGLSLEISTEAVAKDGDGDFFDIIDGDAKAAVHGGEGLAAVDEVLAGAGAGAPIDELLDEFGRGLVLGARGADEPRDVFDDVLADSD